jgi:hypothetical protein
MRKLWSTGGIDLAISEVLRGGKSSKNIKKDEVLKKLEDRVRETRGGKATKTKGQ